MNYRQDLFPTNMNDFLKRIHQNCINVFDENPQFQINDIYKFDQSTNKVYFQKTFLRKNENLFNQKNSEIKGLYIFSDNITSKPFYIGISQTVKRRLKQHFYGKEHNQATLVYLKALENYKEEYGAPYNGLRKDFPFENYRILLQTELQQNTIITVKPILDNFELYFSEVYYACYYKTYWNSFETH